MKASIVRITKLKTVCYQFILTLIKKKAAKTHSKKTNDALYLKRNSINEQMALI